MEAAQNTLPPELRLADEAQARSWFQRNKRTISGLAYLTGDASYGLFGLAEWRAAKEHLPDVAKSGLKDTKAASFWGLGGLGMFRYGEEPAARAMQRMQDTLAAYFEEQGIKGEKLLALAEPANRRTLVQKIEDFCYKYPSEILNAVFAIGSLFTISSGIDSRHKKASFPVVGEVSAGGVHIAQGATILAGALAGLFIREKQYTEEEKRQAGPLGRMVQWFREKPLRASSGLYLFNNGVGYINAFTKLGEKKQSLAAAAAGSPEHDYYSKSRHTPLFLLGMAGVYTFANIALGHSSKGAEADSAIQRKAAEQSALVIAALQPEAREKMIDEVAAFLKSQRLGIRDENTMAQAIRDALVRLEAPQATPIPPSVQRSGPAVWRREAERQPREGHRERIEAEKTDAATLEPAGISR